MLRSVSMNISTSGTIPTFREVVAIDIHCSGLQDAEVIIDFTFNLSIDQDSHNITHVTFKRKKICHRGICLFICYFHEKYNFFFIND